MWRLHPVVLRAALWAWFAVTVTRRRLRVHGIAAKRVQAPVFSDRGVRGVTGVLHRLSPTCLERAFVAQSCLSARGDLRDVVIGVPRGGFATDSAHAWLDGSAASGDEQYVEIHRIAALP